MYLDKEKSTFEVLVKAPNSQTRSGLHVVRGSSKCLCHSRRKLVNRSVARIFSFLLLIVAFLPGLCLAAGQIPGEEQPGFLYTITHLHPIAYLILFIVFVLSVVNLIYQRWLFGQDRRLDESESVPAPQMTKRSPIGHPRLPGGLRADSSRRSSATGSPTKQLPEESIDSGIVGPVRPVSKSSVTTAGRPTPLDGVNHPLPSFSHTASSSSDAASQVDKRLQRKAPTTQFKFTSAVDLPSPEEMERREREKLVVSGTVRGPEGKGIASVMVFLTDQEGNRVGQSCRSLPETGEFKVQINEPGHYLIHGYKRGWIMESEEPLNLPIQSGKIDGYVLRMIPEGCMVHGKVIFSGNAAETTGVEVRCVSERGTLTRSDKLNSLGAFKIYGAAFDSRCFLEVRGSAGDLLATSEAFATGRKREIYREIVIPVPDAAQAGKPEAPDPPITWTGNQGSAGAPSIESPADHLGRT